MVKTRSTTNQNNIKISKKKIKIINKNYIHKNNTKFNKKFNKKIKVNYNKKHKQIRPHKSKNIIFKKFKKKIANNLSNLSNTSNSNTQQHYYNKEHIPKRIRELVWTTYNGEVFTNKCYVYWCDNKINVFNFQTGHDIPESKGGTLELDNLKPICSSCNLSMGNKYSITEWSKLIII